MHPVDLTSDPAKGIATCPSTDAHSRILYPAAADVLGLAADTSCAEAGARLSTYLGEHRDAGEGRRQSERERSVTSVCHEDLR
jgi:hypothetical protein